MKVSPATKPIWFPKTLLAVFKAYNGVFNLSTFRILSFVSTEATIVDPSKLLCRSVWGDATSKCQSESNAYKEHVRVQWEVKALNPRALIVMYSRFRTFLYWFLVSTKFHNKFLNKFHWLCWFLRGDADRTWRWKLWRFWQWRGTTSWRYVSHPAWDWIKCRICKLEKIIPIINDP